LIKVGVSSPLNVPGKHGEEIGKPGIVEVTVVTEAN